MKVSNYCSRWAHKKRSVTRVYSYWR